MAYIGLPIFLALWLIHKFVTHGKMVPLEQVDVSGIDVESQRLVD